MYARFFHDRLEFFADAFASQAPGDTGPVITGAELVAGHGLNTVLECFAAGRGIANRRAAATDWSKFFFARLIIPAVVVQTSTERPLDLDPANWRMHCRDDGTVSRFVFDSEPLAESGTPGDMSSLIDTVVTPLIATLSADCGLSPRVFASNAAMYYSWALEQLDLQQRTPEAARREARSLLDAPRRADNGPNPFHAPFKTLAPGARDGDGEPVTLCRRLCCVRDLDPNLALCSNCPRVITYEAPDASALNRVS